MHRAEDKESFLYLDKFKGLENKGCPVPSLRRNIVMSIYSSEGKMRFPSKHVIRNKIVKAGIADSIQYLSNHRSSLEKYRDIEDLVLRDEEWATKTNEDPKILRGCEYHLNRIRNRLAKELWSRDFYLGISVLDHMLFSSFAHHKSKDPLIHALERIKDSGVLRAGIVIYPLHSMGVLGAGILHAYTAARVSFSIPIYGIMITPQTNSMEGTIEFLECALGTLKINKTLPYDLIEHWRRSRPTKWLERNPLLVMKIHSFPGDYYENQYFLVCKLKLATTLICMLYALQEGKKSARMLFDSSRTNNWETLDIKHYLVLYPKPNSRNLVGDCVPMNVGRSALADLSEAPVQIDPTFWRSQNPICEKLSEALRKTMTGFSIHCIREKGDNPNAKMYKKLFRSLEFYKRSFRIREDVGESALNLAVAFEILLTDQYSPGVHYNRIMDRLSILLKGIEGARKFRDSVDKLFRFRGKYVHSGSSDSVVNLHHSKVAFIYAFLSLTSRLALIPKRAAEPIRYLLPV